MAAFELQMRTKCSQFQTLTWNVKGHCYNSAFYNYPYTFSLLFGLGLYAQYQEAPAAFQPGFWRSSLDIIRSQIAEFEVMVRHA